MSCGSRLERCPTQIFSVSLEAPQDNNCNVSACLEKLSKLLIMEAILIKTGTAVY
jgi:hypothetical protein